MIYFKKFVLVLFLIGVVIISGCVSIEEYVKVFLDGIIEFMILVLEMLWMVYFFMV